MRFHPPKIEELISEFLSGEDVTMADGLTEPFAVPELVWQAVLCLLQQPLSDEQFALLAAGPLEDLLGYHGPQFIDRVESEAQKSIAFAELLGGVWQGNMSHGIWARVEAARKGKEW